MGRGRSEKGKEREGYEPDVADALLLKSDGRR